MGLVKEAEAIELRVGREDTNEVIFSRLTLLDKLSSPALQGNHAY